jgi:hypothetical protein
MFGGSRFALGAVGAVDSLGPHERERKTSRARRQQYDVVRMMAIF